MYSRMDDNPSRGDRFRSMHYTLHPPEGSGTASGEKNKLSEKQGAGSFYDQIDPCTKAQNQKIKTRTDGNTKSFGEVYQVKAMDDVAGIHQKYLRETSNDAQQQQPVK